MGEREELFFSLFCRAYHIRLYFGPKFALGPREQATDIVSMKDDDKRGRNHHVEHLW